MIEVADVFRRFADEYLSAHGASMPPSHRRAIADIQACRTEALGGGLWRCDQCAAEVFSYRSCKNRSCPKCHSDQTERWLAARKAEMLPTRYFHVTVTVPEELRDALRANQRDGYALLMKAAAEATIELARDPRHVGATVGVLAVLHTWTQQLLYHPHVHCLVTGSAACVPMTAAIGSPARRAFLVPAKALAASSKARQAQAPVFQKSVLTWSCPKRRPRSKPWVVHCTPWGEGEQAVLDYLARYVFRVAITNTRIVGLDDQAVTIRHKQRKSNRLRMSRIPGQEFMRRFLHQHTSLPKGPLHKGPLLRLVASRQAPRTPPAPACCFGSTSQATPLQARSMSAEAADPSADSEKSDSPRVCPCCRAKASSCLSAKFPRSGPKDHDPPGTPSPRDKLQVVLACVRHATNTYQAARRRQSSGL